MTESTNREIGDFWENRWRTGDTPWDHGEPAPPFAEFVEKACLPSGRVLIPGCGSGHDVRFFAELGATVTGLDISPSAVEHARRANPHANASYAVGDLLAPESHLEGSFDWLIEHTCLCAMPPHYRTAYARAIPRYLKCSGNFLAIFYRQPHSPDGPPFGIEAEEIDALFSEAFTLERSWVPASGYASRVGREEIRWYKRRGTQE